MQNAPDIPAERFTAMTRLDHNRAKSLLARKAGVSVADVSRLAIWGNHSPTQYPDAHHACIAGRPATEAIGDRSWLFQEFIPTVQQRGTAVIQMAGKSSAASAANALLGHVRDWAYGTPANDWVSMAVSSRGQYGVLRASSAPSPVAANGGAWQVVEGLEWTRTTVATSRQRRRTGAESATPCARCWPFVSLRRPTLETLAKSPTVSRARPSLTYTVQG
jgi:malate dehydrogenase